MKTCVFIAIVVVGLSGGRFSDEKGCCLSSKTREKNVCRGRMFELITEMARVAEVDRGILWDEEGNWPEVLKSRACSRECPVVWPLWTSGLVQHRKSEIHGLPISLRMFRVKSDKSDWFWSQSIVFSKPFKNGMSLDRARGRDSWCWPKGARPLGTRMDVALK